MSPLFFQIFLLINVFLIGIVTALTVRHIYVHFRPSIRDAEKSQAPHLPAAAKERLLRGAEAKFQAMLEFSAHELQDDLQVTANKLNHQLEELGKEIIQTEMERYRDGFEELRKQSETAISGAQDELAKHQAELAAKLTEHEVKLKVRLTKEVNAEKQKLGKQIDDKLADAMASFLVDTLGRNVDLGAQTAYLTAQLKEHKDDFKKEVDDEATIAQ